MAITEKRPTTGECPRATSLQRIHERPAYSPRHAQLCVCRRPCRHYTEHRVCTNRGNTDLSSSRIVGVLHLKPAPCESDKDASQPLPSAESRMWQTAQHQLERGEPNPLQPPGVSWRHTGPNVVIIFYKAHIEKTKKKVGTRNNIIRKLRNSKWGATPTTLRSSALALCDSAAEYACPVWERSTHAKKLNATLNETCRMITGCLKPTNINSLPILAGIAPSDIRRAVASRTERTRQTMDERHPLNGHLEENRKQCQIFHSCQCVEGVQRTTLNNQISLLKEHL